MYYEDKKYRARMKSENNVRHLSSHKKDIHRQEMIRGRTTFYEKNQGTDRQNTIFVGIIVYSADWFKSEEDFSCVIRSGLDCETASFCDTAGPLMLPLLSSFDKIAEVFDFFIDWVSP